MPVSRQQQELIQMKSFPLSPPGVLYCTNDVLVCLVSWKPIHLTAPTSATSDITLNIQHEILSILNYPANDHLFILMPFETCIPFFAGTQM